MTLHDKNDISYIFVRMKCLSLYNLNNLRIEQCIKVCTTAKFVRIGATILAEVMVDS